MIIVIIPEPQTRPIIKDVHFSMSRFNLTIIKINDMKLIDDKANGDPSNNRNSGIISCIIPYITVFIHCTHTIF